MKQCLACNAIYATSIRECPKCGGTPAVVDGFDAYAPEMAHDGGGFEAGYFSVLADLESANFWFRARNRLIIWALKTYAPRMSSYLEVGCGTGFVLSGVANAFPEATLSGSEIFTAGLAFAANRLPSVRLMQMDARKIPFVDEFEVIGAFDVIEHIAEDVEVLQQIHKALRPDGCVVLTVPQHAWLWSSVDEYARHERRYSASELHSKLTLAKFRVVKSTSFVSSLLPLMMISRMAPKQSGSPFDPLAEFRINPLFNRILENLINLEIAGIGLGLNYRAGGSRLVVAKKA